MTADSSAAIRDAAARIAAAGESPAHPARDPVNLPMINNWVEAIGDANPVYTDAEFAARSVHGGLVAPPAMAQVWTMRGLHPPRDRDDPLGLMIAALDEAGFTSVVATNCEQEYHRYLRHGERVTVRASLVDVAGPKQTSLGEGWFVTTRNTWYVGQEAVTSMIWRVLKFRPAAPQPPAQASPAAPQVQASDVLRPVISRDTAFFWDGTAAGELRIQRCGECGALRHPPGPMCPACGAAKPDYVVAAGTGEVYSYVVQHHPPVPGKKLPIVVALVQLPEGVRMVGELLGVGPERVRIGLPVRAEFVRIDDTLTLPAWREDFPAGLVLPELVVDVTPTFVVASAIATRDFQEVHHDRDLAVKRGSKDIFINILTTTGLVQRYVTDWAGPEALVRSVAIRLGVPCYAGDTLTFSGKAAEAAGDEHVVDLAGRCSLGNHVTGTVRVARARAGWARISGAAAIAGIAGIGATEFSKDSGRSELRLAGEATAEALADAGLTPSDVDGLVTFAMDSTAEIALARELGVGELTFFSHIGYGGGAACATVQQAAMAVATGIARVVVCYRALNERSGNRFGQVSRSAVAAPTSSGVDNGWHYPMGLAVPAATVAMIARRYMHDYGATSEDFGLVTVADRRHAAANPRAWFYQRPVTLAEHQASRWIVEPLRLLDCCQESDGAVAVVVTSLERAAGLRQPPAVIRAAAQGSGPDQFTMTSYYRDELGLPEMGVVARQLWRQAGTGPQDVRAAVLYDHFTPYVLLQLEELGFCPRGEARHFIAGGAIELGGRLPVNPHGGQLGEAYIHGMNGIAEAVRQVRGTSVNQVDGDGPVLVTAGTGVPTSGLVLGPA